MKELKSSQDLYESIRDDAERYWPLTTPAQREQITRHCAATLFVELKQDDIERMSSLLKIVIRDGDLALRRIISEYAPELVNRMVDDMAADPLLPQIGLASRYPVEALGDFGQAVEDLHDLVKAPLPLCAAAVLGSLSLTAQGGYDVEVEGREPIPMSLFLLSVAESGERKSAVDAAVYRYLEDMQREAQREHRKEIDELGKHETPPPDPNLMVADSTVEALQLHLRRAKYASVGLISNEAVRILAGYSLTGDARGRSLGVLSDMYDAKPTAVYRMGEGRSYMLYGRRLTVTLAGQPEIVGPFLSDPLASSQGLTGRFLVAHCERTPPHEWPGGGVCYTQGMQRLYKAQADLYRECLTCQEVDEGTRRRRVIKASTRGDKSENGLDEWKAVYQHVTYERYRSEDRALFSFWGKAADHVLRIAGVLAAAHGQEAIDAKRIRSTFRLVQWYASDMGRALDIAAISEDDKMAHQLSEWLADFGGDELTLRTIQQKGPRRIRRQRASGVRYLMERLRMAGYVTHADRDRWVILPSHR